MTFRLVSLAFWERRTSTGPRLLPGRRRQPDSPSATRRFRDCFWSCIERADQFDSALDWLNRTIRHQEGNTTALERDDVLDRIQSTVRDVSHTIAEGNLKVFAELAPEFLRAIKTFQKDTEFKQATIDGFVEPLLVGPASQGGQELLRSAFSNYYRARFETDFKKRAELILLANGQVGLHEQTRLQPNIERALNAPVEDLLAARMVQAVEEKTGNAMLVHRVAANRPHHLGPLLDLVAEQWRHFATHFLMKLALPGDSRLALGEDVPPLRKDEEFPTPLVRLTLPELLEFAGNYLSALAARASAAAHDWAEPRPAHGLHRRSLPHRSADEPACWPRRSRPSRPRTSKRARCRQARSTELLGRLTSRARPRMFRRR